MESPWWPTIVVVALGCLAWCADRAGSRDARRTDAALRWFLGTYAGLQVLWLLYVSVDHLWFPLHIDLMEGTVWQHFERAAALQPIYPAPTPEFVPLAYNPLYYVLAAPFGWVLGTTMPTLRLVAILGMVTAGAVLYAAVQRRARSHWWALMAVGLFAAAYRAMDTYLDNAHSDSWFLAAALLGTLVLDRRHSLAGLLGGTAILVSSFWFKQHGALFVIGGLTAITWRDGVRRAYPAWALAALLGPVTYVLAGPSLFGSHFHYFTWAVPAGWSDYDLGLVRRLAAFFVRHYAVLVVAAAGVLLSTAVAFWQGRGVPMVWEVQLVFALLTGVMGSLDAGSADNVFIAAGTWLILSGTLGLSAAARNTAVIDRWRLPLLALVVSFALLAYDPRSVLTSSSANARYADLIAELRGLDGPVYAPGQGQLSKDFQFRPAAHWVALDDITRGPTRGEDAQRLARELLAPALRPEGHAYVLSSRPLDAIAPVLVELSEAYVLEQDFGERFKPLRVLPKRFDHGWPRYLYRYDPERRSTP